MCFFKEAVLAILSNFSCAGSNAPPLTPVSSSTTPRASGATRDPLGPPLTVGHRIDPLRRSGARTQAPSAAVLERDLMAVGKRAGGGLGQHFQFDHSLRLLLGFRLFWII